MIEVTQSAKDELKRLLEKSSLDPGKSLRLAMPPVWEGEGDFGIVIANEGHGDHAVAFQGSTILLVDPALTERLSDSVLDFKDSRFTLDVY
jgi:Fe-S cluster assembly iron-binding protein IscA